MKKLAKTLVALAIIAPTTPIITMQTAVAASECGGRHVGKCWDVDVCPSQAVLDKRGTTCSIMAPKDHVLIRAPKQFSKKETRDFAKPANKLKLAPEIKK
ncbi:hypothetical protein WNZ14_05910 [Hoeflea sp. AS60]|uniref:hypothetical protein n=1 Tax=Hoeflea sp. AS60 TaxID=3135780 RepID=UPI00317FD65C